MTMELCDGACGSSSATGSEATGHADSSRVTADMVTPGPDTRENATRGQGESAPNSTTTSQTLTQNESSPEPSSSSVDIDSQAQDPGEGTSTQSQSSTTSTESEQSSANGAQTSTFRRMERVRRRWRSRGTYLLGSVRGPVPVKGQSFCDCPKEGRDVDCTCGEEDTVFDWTWSKDTRSSAAELSDNHRDVRFHVNYSSGTAAVRGTKALTDTQCFWEIKMTTPVYGTDMMVGVGTANVVLDAYRHNFCSLLGRDGESWGLSYYGRVQHKDQFRTITGAMFGQGTIIGAHLDMWHGTLSFYKNRRPLGVAYRGLAGKVLYPMLSSTAARTGMRMTKSCSFPTSLQFFCCQVLRKMVPPHLDVTDALDLPPGLQAFLANNLSWLLRPSELSDVRCKRKRSGSGSDSEDDSSEEENASRSKRTRIFDSSDEADQ